MPKMLASMKQLYSFSNLAFKSDFAQKKYSLAHSIDNPFRSSFGYQIKNHNLRSIRLLQGMKQELFARKMGVSQQYISKIELLQKLSKKKLELSAKALGVSVETIENFDENTCLSLRQKQSRKN
jgi:DNA-binding transcriptional regulator YiaG